ncbi:serine protease [Clostridium botulinum C]|uniref:S1 family peptidase n=1 Tax=Clostridium botulinum TaxID=1491 RepID=UPI001E3B9233|nr:S1 family peptidase [Clostridium botulinum]MCD3255977.1 serine protease [Clostridium botulinum C]
MYNCSSLEKKILHIARYEYNYFLNKSNVVGIGLGYKIKNGFNTFQKCLSVFVSNKISYCNLSSSDIIPKYYKGIQTDVVNTGRFHLQRLNSKVRPVPGGYSIGPSTILAGGTLGCIVTDGKYYHILSCNHTLTAEQILSLNYPIVQPNALYGGKDPEDTIATLSKYIPINYKNPNSQGINYGDCAIAKIISRSKISTKIAFLGRLKGMAKPFLGLEVQKVGATSELTKGIIKVINATIEFDTPQGKSIFVNQIITSRMSEAGDSGAILVDKNIKAIGMLMSANPIASSFNPIEYILNALDVKLVTD